MANLSQERRERMLVFLDKLRTQNQDDVEQVRAINEIAQALNEKKYGLVWEEHTEEVEEMLKGHIPVLEEVEERKIMATEDDAYNFLIEGDNLHSLKLLEKTHKGKIDVIYIDPPYNTGKKDFTYEDAFVDKVDTYSHSKWLSFMEHRLKIAKILLSNNGVIFISIDDNEHAQLKLLCDEIFGASNYLNSFVRKTKSMTGDDGNGINIQHEYLIIYGKNKNKLVFIGEEKSFSNYSNPDNDVNGIWTAADPSAKSGGDSTYYPIINPFTGQTDYPPKGRYWAFSRATMKEYIRNGRIKFKENVKKNQRGFIFKRYARLMENKSMPVDSLQFIANAYMNSVATTELKLILGAGKFDYPKPSNFIKDIIKFSSNIDSIILDFFAGSGTTGHAVMALNKEDGGNRKYILCTNNENNICEEVTYQRLKNIQEELPHNLKYLRTNFVNKLETEDSLGNSLLQHIKPLIELEHACDLEASKYRLLMDEDEFDEFIENNEIPEGGKLFIAEDIMVSLAQQIALDKASCELIRIPEYYYGDELVEAGEL